MRLKREQKAREFLDRRNYGKNPHCSSYRVVVRQYALPSVDLSFNTLVESHQKTLKNDIHSLPAWRSAFKECCGEQDGKFVSCILA